MTSTLTPTCSFCGLRFENRPLLELHIREDHPRHGTSAEPGHGRPAGAPASPAKARTSVTGPPRPSQPHSGLVRTGLRRLIGASRRANAELLLAAELMARPAGPPRPRQPASPPAEPDAHQATAGERIDRAA